MPAEYFEYRHLSVLKVVDGDTVDIRLDLGFRIYTDVRLRLYGINAPERFTVAGPAAKEYLEGLLAAEPALTLRTFKDRRDGFGRYIGDLRGVHGSISRLMVEGGHATRYMENLEYDWRG